MKAGIPAEKLAALDAFESDPQFTDRERAALGFATAIAREDLDVTDACWARVREHFSEAETVELVFAVGFQTFATQFAKAFQLAPQGFSR